MTRGGALYYYWTRFFDHPGASRQVARLPWRVLQFAAMQLFGLSATYPIRFGPGRFRFRYLPLGRGEGARGAFFLREGYEPLLEFGAFFLRPGDTAIDCGANQGLYACAFAAATGPRGRVLAVEPLPWQAERARANLALNGFEEHGTLVEAAVSDAEGEATLHLGAYDVSASLARVEGGARQLPVRSVTLDALAAAHGLGPVALLKLDVEGAEVAALAGASGLLSAPEPPVICAEVNGGTGPAIMAALAPHGYLPFTLDREGLHPLAEFGTHANVFFLPPAPRARLAREGRIR